MEYRNLGHSGLKVSTLCLGTMTFGEADENSFMHKVGCSEEESHAIMNKALDEGINFFDTANVYGNDGLTERVIGNWFEKDKRREDVVLATKFRFRMSPGPNGTGASRHQIMSAVEGSLKRLKTDYIDLYQLHMQDIETPEEETLRALDDLISQGKVRYIGCSNYAAYRLVESLWSAEKHNTARFVSLQPRYNLLSREIEREHVPVCTKHGLGIIPWSPLQGGLLSGKYKKGEAPPEGSRLEKWKSRLEKFDNDKTWNVLGALEAVAKEVDAPMPAVALAWLLNKPGVTSVIFGARNLEQLDGNLAAAELELPESAMKTLDEASALDVGYPYEFIRNVQKRW
jgi:aryl-alcohol dehydrogenase-like predicted oxidoreductase